MYTENLHEHAAGVCTMWHLLIECFLRNAFIIYEEIESVSNTRTHPCTLQHTALPAPVSVNVSNIAEEWKCKEFYLNKMDFYAFDQYKQNN